MTAQPTSSVGSNSYANFGPLTTTFTPPSSCNRIAYQTDTVFVDARTIWGGRQECYPNSQLWSLHYSAVTIDQIGFSPGLHCPVGYSTAASWSTASPSVPLLPPQILKEGESAVFCCPKDYFLGTYGDCFSYPSVGESITSETYLDGSWVSVTTAKISLSTEPVRAWAIQLRYQGTDLPPGATASQAKNSRSTASVTSDTLGTTSTSSAGDSNTSLSLGAKIAIGIVIPLVTIALLLGVFIFFRRRKRNAGLARATQETAYSGDSLPDRKSAVYVSPPQELSGGKSAPDARSPQELPAPTVAQELDSTTPSKAAGRGAGK